MPAADPCSVTIYFRLGWRWHVAERAVRVLPHLGVSLRTCVRVLDWGLSGSELKIGNAGWVPAGLPKIKLEDIV